MSPGHGEPTASTPPSDGARDLARRFGLTLTVAEWLWRCGQRPGEELARFLEPRLAHLTPPTEMADRQTAAARLARAIRDGERVTVFGDYDCDGITSTAIVTEVIRTLGGTATPLLASRFDGGYGVSGPATDRILASRPSLLVTCDCGSSDHASLRRVADAGVDTIVIDHHLVPDEPLPALAFLNPHRPECGYPYKGLASCGLALSIAAALRKELGRPLDVRQWLDLVAIGTIADVAPLDGDNRALVRAGLTALAESRRPGLRALLELAKVDLRAPLTGRDVAFRLAPKINAPGRMGPPDVALQLLMAKTDEEATGLAAQVQQQSEARREAQNRIAEEAAEDIRSQHLARRPAIVVGRPGWNHGIVGIVAGRLADDHGLPVCVVGFDGDTGRGSLRGPFGFRLHDALSQVSDTVVRFGGHQAAAGVEVELARFDEFRQRFEAACGAAPSDPRASARPSDVVSLAQEDRIEAVASDLKRLEPCGEKNPRPRMCFTACVESARRVSGGHLKLELRTAAGETLGAFAVGRGALAEEMSPGAEVSVTGDLRPDTWRGGGAVEVFVEELTPRPRLSP